MNKTKHILFIICLLWLAQNVGAASRQKIGFDFYGVSFGANYKAAEIVLDDSLCTETIDTFFEQLKDDEYEPVVTALLNYKHFHKPDDWIYYQLIRKTANAICPKNKNYNLYTLYKCYFLGKSGYDVALVVVDDKLLFYVQNDEEIYDIPFFRSGGKKYVCLNYHDFGYNVDFDRSNSRRIMVPLSEAQNAFSYKLSRLPEFSADSYYEKALTFDYRGIKYHFNVKLNNEVRNIFTNYPVVDYSLYLNEPLSKETYNSLVPQLKKNVEKMSIKKGVDYLMHFTRYAFSYEADHDNFGREKHLSPEQTLLYDNSDCEDRAALFYCLVKEIYNLPMIVVAFPHHTAVAVKLDKPIGRQISYNGNSYSICEPTPQADDLPVGAISAELKTATFEIAYSYVPAAK